jgi:enediyne biosynthesis protein E4
MSTTSSAGVSGVARGRRWRRLMLALFCGAGLILGGRTWWVGRRYRTAMDEIESHVVAGRYASACRDLNQLLSWRADPTGGLVYLLGSCELARGRDRAAAEAWERVVPGSAFSERAIRSRVRLLRDAGQLAAAERLVGNAASDRRNDRTAVLMLIVPTLSELGRIDEAVRLVETRWEHLNDKGEAALEPAIKLLRQHVDLTLKPAPVETIRAALDRAARLARDDDRVWLGRANLAIRTGAYDEAERWLDSCLRIRPEDVPVWQARLNWGLATHRTDVVRQAMTHIPTAESTPAQLHRLRAYLAAARGDVATECRELERLCQIDPAEPTALDRLVQLAEQDGQPTRAAEFRRKQAEIDRLRNRYEKLHARQQPIRDAVEMGRLAAELGRRFEARAFLTLAVWDDPDRQDLRLDLVRLAPTPATDHPRGQTLAEALAD